MIWIIKLLQRAARIDPSDVLNQQTGDDLLELFKELIT